MTRPQEKVDDKDYLYKRRYERIIKYHDLFNSLRDAQIRVRAVIGNKKVDTAVENLFKSRNAVAIAIEQLADFSKDTTIEPSSEIKELSMRYRKEIYGSFSEKDELGQKILNSIQTIEKELNPFARLDAK